MFWGTLCVIILVFFSMMLLDGHQRNTTRTTNNPMVARVKEARRWQFKLTILLPNLALCGMKHLVTIMMLLLGSTMMEIQVHLLVNLCPYPIGFNWSLLFICWMIFAIICLLTTFCFNSPWHLGGNLNIPLSVPTFFVFFLTRNKNFSLILFFILNDLYFIIYS